jgi:glycerol-3-phosphate acyltransferase PlsX
MIAVDAMGGDFAPHVVVHGALNAAKKGVAVTLFGDEAQIVSILNTIDSDWHTFPFSIVHCSEFIKMDDEPSKSVLHKKDSSLVRAVESLNHGAAKAVISAGNSGAALVAGTLLLGRVPGVLRPAIGNFLPTDTSSVFCIDLGANADCKPEYLEQFAIMGHVYVQQTRGIKNPRVALLSNGAEPYKGSTLIKESYDRLQSNKLINFVGNIEPREVFEGGTDVLVCDGFSGNVMLKTVEGTVRAMTRWLKAESSYSPLAKIGFFLSKSVFARLKQKTDYAKIGGALLLGVTKPLVIAHGCSNADAIENAILYADKSVQDLVLPIFNQTLSIQISFSKTAASSSFIHEVMPPL